MAVIVGVLSAWATIATMLFYLVGRDARRTRADHADRWQRVVDRIWGRAPLPLAYRRSPVDAARIRACLRRALDDEDRFTAMVACIVVGAYDTVYDLDRIETERTTS